MTQILRFEPAWERTICEQDRKAISEKFLSTEEEDVSGVSFTYLWHAYNHRKALLITMLIHNWSSEAIRFSDRHVRCSVDERQIVARKFSLPFDILAHTSIPWTFMFPEGDVNIRTEIEEDAITID